MDAKHWLVVLSLSFAASASGCVAVEVHVHVPPGPVETPEPGLEGELQPDLTPIPSAVDPSPPPIPSTLPGLPGLPTIHNQGVMP